MSSKAHRAKGYYLQEWEKTFRETDPQKKLKELADSNYPEFLRLGIAAMPKEAKVDITVSRYESWSDADLKFFVETGVYPDNSKIQDNALKTSLIVKNNEHKYNRSRRLDKPPVVAEVSSVEEIIQELVEDALHDSYLDDLPPVTDEMG